MIPKSTRSVGPLLLANTLITLFSSPCFTCLFTETTILLASRETPVPAPALAHADIWYAFYNTINRYGLDKSHMPIIPTSIISQGCIPPIISKYINNAFITGARDARAMALNAIVFPVPNYNAEETATCVLKRYYQQGYGYLGPLGPPLSPAITITTVIAPAGALPVPAPTLVSYEPILKINLPKEFTGDRNKYNKFRTQLILYFVTNPSQFENNKVKIIFAASFLRGSAADWWVPKINTTITTNETTTITMVYITFEEFIKALRAVFDDPDTITTFAYNLQHLRQGKKIIFEYYIKFLTLFARLNWNKNTLVHHFK